MGIEHEILGTAVGRSNHSPKRDFMQFVFSKLIHKLHTTYDVRAIDFFFINR